MGKYSNAAMAKKLDTLARVGRSRSQSTIGDIWQNTGPDDNTTATGPFRSISAGRTFFNPLDITSLVRCRYVRAITTTYNEAITARIYQLASFSIQGSYAIGIPNVASTFRALTPVANSTTPVGSSSDLLTFDFGQDYLLDPSKGVLAVAFFSNIAGSFLRSKSDQVGSGTFEPLSASIITPGTLSDTLELGGNTNAGYEGPLAFITLLGERGLVSQFY